MRKETIEVGSRWQHFKGDVMTIITLAFNTETLEKMVIYEHKHNLWARPISVFLSTEDVSKREDNKTGQKYRFEKIGEMPDEIDKI